MPNRRPRTKSPNIRELPRTRQKALAKIKKITAYHSERVKYFETMQKTFAPTGEGPEYEKGAREHIAGIEKGKALANKIKGMKINPLRKTPLIKTLMRENRHQAETIIRNKNAFMTLPPYKQAALRKLAAGKRPTRREINTILDTVADYRWIIHGEQAFSPENHGRHSTPL